MPDSLKIYEWELRLKSNSVFGRAGDKSTGRLQDYKELTAADVERIAKKMRHGLIDDAELISWRKISK